VCLEPVLHTPSRNCGGRGRRTSPRRAARAWLH
jgi:hypothetical protein